MPKAAPRYWAKRLVPPIEFGSMHASKCTSYLAVIRYTVKQPSHLNPYTFAVVSFYSVLFQMALIPFTMSRYTIATFSNSSLNKYLPLDKALRIHIHLGYTMVSIVFSATIVFFIFFGLSCSEGEEAFCDKFTSEIMITGYCILGLLVSSLVVRRLHPNVSHYLCSLSFCHCAFLTSIYSYSWLERRTFATLFHMNCFMESISSSSPCMPLLLVSVSN